ncbi:hypothetical protein FRC18_011331 [Serendipita sp. 400]|nr:hypothetical protein FRC18_011331 [Serendipita sp. 400]
MNDSAQRRNENPNHTREISRSSSTRRRDASATETSLALMRIHWVFWVLGAAILLPWNAMITAIPFFVERMSNSPFRSTFSSYFSAIYQLTSFISLYISSVTKSSKSSRIIFSHGILTITLGSLFLSTLIPSRPLPFFIFSLTVGAIQAAAVSFLLTAVVAYAAYFGPMAMQSIMSGQAAVAVVVSIIQLITILSTSSRGHHTTTPATEPQPTKTPVSRSASYFFFISTMALSFSYMAYRRLTRMPLFRSTVSTFEAAKVNQETAQYAALPEDEPTVPFSAGIDSDEDEEGALLTMSTSVSSLPTPHGAGTLHASSAAPRETHHDPPLEGMGEVEPVQNAGFWRIWWTNAMFNVSVIIIYVVTLAVFPAITSAVKSVDPKSNPHIFTAVHFLVFNTSDWIGRYVCSYKLFQIWSRKTLMGLSVSRLLFILLFLACNVSLGALPTTPDEPAPTSIAPRMILTQRNDKDISFVISDTAFFVLLAAFGFTNGWLTSLIMMAAPSLEHNKRMRKEWVDTAAVCGSFSLAAGLTLGSGLNFVIRGLACGCNPFLH